MHRIALHGIGWRTKVLDIIVWTILVCLAAALLWAIISGKMSDQGNFAATSVFADMQNQEKRNAMETVIEEKAGKKRFGQTNGNDPDAPHTDTKDL
ncbi:MAG: hypothetical protein HUU02_08345 [Bacteroidetes bacterium]|nr:hypothetical protein [Bacteroidota bacterium]